MGLAR
jgi:hypothetical protein